MMEKCVTITIPIRCVHILNCEHVNDPAETKYQIGTRVRPSPSAPTEYNMCSKRPIAQQHRSFPYNITNNVPHDATHTEANVNA